MANSNICVSSGLAPTDFNISASFEDTNHIISVAVERCQLCGPTKRPFYCNKCVTRGQFVHSKPRTTTTTGTATSSSGIESLTVPILGLSYSQNLQRWHALKKERSETLSRFEKVIHRHQVAGEKKIAIDMTKKRLVLLQKAVDATKVEVKQNKASLRTLTQENTSRVAKSRRHQEKRCSICQYISQMQTYVTEQHNMLSACHAQLAVFRREHVHDLLKYIFAVTEIQPKSESGSMVDALAEARHTAYVRGRWVYTDNGSEHQYQVVAPSLPGNGDYSAYSTWLLENRDVAGLDAEFGQRNPAYTVCAALSHTAQLVSLLAYFLQINLPEILCFSEFLAHDLTETQFTWAVYRLNHNVLFLCFTQFVDPEQLNAKCTVRNILMLLKSEVLGSNGAFCADKQLMQSVDGTLPLEAIPDSDDQPEYDWEQVPTHLPHPHHIDSCQSSSPPAQPISPGLMSSAVASVASFWRAATGRHDSG